MDNDGESPVNPPTPVPDTPLVDPPSDVPVVLAEDQLITLEIVSWRDVLPCGDRVLGMYEKLATITLEPDVNVGFVARAIQDSLAGVKPPA